MRGYSIRREIELEKRVLELEKKLLTIGNKSLVLANTLENSIFIKKDMIEATKKINKLSQINNDDINVWNE